MSQLNAVLKIERSAPSCPEVMHAYDGMYGIVAMLCYSEDSVYEYVWTPLDCHSCVHTDNYFCLIAKGECIVSTAAAVISILLSELSCLLPSVVPIPKLELYECDDNVEMDSTNTHYPVPQGKS